jgi:CheY-like chemotaxis protein
MAEKKSIKKIEILLVEDDEFDAKLTEKFLNREDINYSLHLVRDGEVAMNFLNKTQPYKGVPTPDVIILDMGLPRMNGQEVLDQIKLNPKLKNIPVIILTGQQLEGDPVKQFELHENAYINKWLQMADFKALIKAVADYSQFRSQNDKT